MCIVGYIHLFLTPPVVFAHAAPARTSSAAAPIHCVCVIAHADGGTRATPGPAHSRPDSRHTQRSTDIVSKRECVFKAPRTYTGYMYHLRYRILVGRADQWPRGDDAPLPLQAVAKAHHPIFYSSCHFAHGWRAESGARRGRRGPDHRTVGSSERYTTSCEQEGEHPTDHCDRSGQF